MVADEVRSLAQRSAVAASETAEKIEDAVSKSEQGVAISARVSNSLSDIVAKARDVDQLVAQISSASKEQSMGINQINEAVGQVDQVTQANSASAEETASASEELNAQSAELKSVVDSLNIMLGRKRFEQNALIENTRSLEVESFVSHHIKPEVKKDVALPTPKASIPAKSKAPSLHDDDFKDF